MSNIQEVLEKYKDAEEISPAFERVYLFSWNDMLALKAEIEDLRHQLAYAKEELRNDQ